MTQTVPDISPLMPMHLDPLLVDLLSASGTATFSNMSPNPQGREKPILLARWTSLSGVPDYFGRNKISSGADLSHYSSASLY